MNNFNDLAESFEGARILLVGDIMLDTFVYGGVSRISPEGPIPVLSVTREDKMLGGAGNVFANLRAMGCDVDVVTIVGQDAAGREIMDNVEDKGSTTKGFVIDETRPTILKTRYISQGQQLLRVDRENVADIKQTLEQKIINYVSSIISDANILVLSDYGKGTLTPTVIKDLIKLAKKYKVPVVVDPKKKDISLYKGATVITPNKKELSEATGGKPVSTDEEVELAGTSLIKMAGVESVIATRSENGMSVISKRGKPLHLKTKALEVYDVSGAGDTVVAAIAAILSVGGSLEQAAEFANVAGGLAVAKVGTAVIRKDEILETLHYGDVSQDRIAPICDWDSAKEQVKKWQAQGLKVGFTNGCFDIVHYGHVNYLNQARDKCDRLILGLNHDKSVRILKGPERPINDEMARATVMGALSSIDMVVFFGAEKEGEDNTPCAVVGHVQPDILMKGGDYTVDQLPEGKVVLSYGGQVEIMPLYEGYSTTNIIKKTKTQAA
jgi:D-beta-D-heptose 7-phosphate kinase/D-beta-D-heptose 1-phosphate adenosyltransferase